MEVQALLVHLMLSDGSFGESTEWGQISALEETLEEVLASTEVGEYDGNEYGEGECVLHMYGIDADALYNLVAPILKSSVLCLGGYVIKRYGEYGAPEVRIDL